MLAESNAEPGDITPQIPGWPIALWGRAFRLKRFACRDVSRGQQRCRGLKPSGNARNNSIAHSRADRTTTKKLAAGQVLPVAPVQY